ncbi:MAG: hypothetical protein GWP06_10120 [Actinobacteria bacterium]|nr:hypothetical protein [Actinomycetota bacterium]
MNRETKNLDYYLKRTTFIAMIVFAAAMPFTIALTQISLFVALLAWLGRLTVTHSLRLRRLSLEWAFLAYIAAEILALIFSTNVPQSFIFLKRLLLIPIVYLFALDALEKKQLNLLATVFIISVTLYSLSGMVSFFLHPSLRVRHIQDSMTAGGITMIGALITFAFAAFATEKRWRWIWFVFALTNTSCLVLTSTRGSWLGFFFGILFIVYFANRKLFIAIPLLIAAFVFLGPQEFSGRVKHIFDPTWRTNAKRIFWWSVGLKIYKDHPIVGIGDVSTTDMFKKYAPPGTKELVGHMHNNFIHIAVTLGTVGLVAFIYMMLQIFLVLLRQFLRAMPNRGPTLSWAAAAVAIFIAFNINGLFEWNFGDAEIITMIWFMTGGALAIPVLSDETLVPAKERIK